MTVPGESKDCTGALVNFYNEHVRGLTAEAEKLEEIKERGGNPDHPSFAFKLGGVATGKTILIDLRALIEFHAAEAAGKLEPSSFIDARTEG